MANAEEFPLQDLADGLGQVVGFISDGQATTLTVNAEAVDAWSSSIAGSDGDLDYVTYVNPQDGRNEALTLFPTQIDTK